MGAGTQEFDAAARQRFLLTLTDVLRGSGETQAILARVSALLGTHFGVNRVGYGHVDEQLDLIDYDVCWTDGSVPTLLGRFPASAFGQPVIERLRAGQTIVIADVRAHPFTSDQATLRTSHEVDTRAILVVPLFKAGRLRTIVYLNQRPARHWAAHEVELMSEVAERTRELIERGRAEQALRASEAKWRGLFERMGEGFFIAEAVRDDAGRMVDFRFVETNPAFERLTGVAVEQAEGRTVREVIPGIQAELIAALARVVDSGEGAEFEAQVPALGERWYDWRARAMGQDQFSVLFLEITQRKATERALLLSEQRFQRMTELALRQSAARQAFLVRLGDVLRPLADPVCVRREACAVLRQHLEAGAVAYAMAAESGAALETVAVAAGAGADAAGALDVLGFGAQVRAQLRAGGLASCADVAGDRRLDEAARAACAAAGSAAWASAPLLKGGRLVALLTVHVPEPHDWTHDELQLLQDVAERTWVAAERARAEAALRESEAGFRTIVDLVPDLLWRNDATGSVDWFNRRWTEFTGQPLEAVLGQGWVEAIHPADRARAGARWRQAVNGGRPFVNEQRIRRHDGSYWWYLVRAEPMRDAAGRIVCWFGSATNVQQQHHAREALEQQVRERTGELEQVVARERAILGSAASAIIATDLSGRIVTFNPGAEALFRMSEHQALHRPVLELYDLGEVRSAAESLPAQVLETMLPEAQPPEGAAEGALRSEWGFVRADGTRFPGLLNVSLLRDGRSCVIGFLCVIADLTERRAMEEVLRQRTAQAESANRAKSAFLATMSHEFRTPLNAVIGLSQLLEQMALPERALTFVRHIGQAGEQLLGLTNDVLDLSRIEAGEMQLEQVHFPLVPLLEAVQALVHPQAVAKGLTLHVEFSPALPAQLCGDPLRLKQILLNLLGNAIKFTRAGRVKLRLQQIGRRPGQVTLRIEVTDTGIGIPAEAQARIFEPFTQADSSTTRRFGGSGLGLSIVRRLVGMMGGQMELESAPQRGSTFRITLPLATAAAGAEARPPGAAAADPAPAA